MADCNQVASSTLDTPAALVVVGVGASVPLSGHWNEVAGPRPCAQSFRFRVRNEATGFVEFLANVGIDTGIVHNDAWPATAAGRYAVAARADYAPGGWPDAPLESFESTEVSVRVVKAALLDDFLRAEDFGVEATVGGVPFRGIYQDPHASALGMAGRNPTLDVEAARAEGIVQQGDLVTIAEKPGLSWIVRGQEPRRSGLARLKLEAL